jgi:hypothetical protein
MQDGEYMNEKAIFLLLALLMFFGCATVGVDAGSAGDSGAELAENVGRISASIDSLTDGIANSLARSRDLEEQFNLIDQFVQGIIAENGRLRKILDDYRGREKGGDGEGE